MTSHHWGIKKIRTTFHMGSFINEEGVGGVQEFVTKLAWGD